MDEAEHALLLPFDTDEPEFARGFEAGRIWAALAEAGEDDEVEATVHAANAEMLIRMGEAAERAVVGEELDETWTRIVFSAQNAAPEPSPGPGHQYL